MLSTDPTFEIPGITVPASAVLEERQSASIFAYIVQKMMHEAPHAEDAASFLQAYGVPAPSGDGQLYRLLEQYVVKGTACRLYAEMVRIDNIDDSVIQVLCVQRFSVVVPISSGFLDFGPVVEAIGSPLEALKAKIWLLELEKHLLGRALRHQLAVLKG